MYYEKLVISQRGQHKCLICEHQFDWELELTTMHNTDMERKYNVIPSQIKTQPNKLIWFNTVGNDKIEVNLGCPRCNSMHKSAPLDMKKE